MKRSIDMEQSHLCAFICIQADVLCYVLLNEKAACVKSVQWSFYLIV